MDEKEIPEELEEEIQPPTNEAIEEHIFRRCGGLFARYSFNATKAIAALESGEKEETK